MNRVNNHKIWNILEGKKYRIEQLKNEYTWTKQSILEL